MTTQGQRIHLECLLKQGLTLRLFTNKPGKPGSLPLAYTEKDLAEPDFEGYTPAKLDDGDWELSTYGSIIEAHAKRKEFTRTKDGMRCVVWGWWLSLGKKLILGERFEESFAFVRDGDELRVYAQLGPEK